MRWLAAVLVGVGLGVLYVRARRRRAHAVDDRRVSRGWLDGLRERGL